MLYVCYIYVYINDRAEKDIFLPKKPNPIDRNRCRKQKTLSLNFRPRFVPSLSWQTERFQMNTWLKNRAFPAPAHPRSTRLAPRCTQLAASARSPPSEIQRDKTRGKQDKTRPPHFV